MIVYVVFQMDEFGEHLPRMRLYKSRKLAEACVARWCGKDGLESHVLRKSVNMRLAREYINIGEWIDAN